MTSFTQGQNDFIPSSSLDRCYNYRWVGYVPGYKGERLRQSLHQERGWFGVSTVQFIYTGNAILSLRFRYSILTPCSL